MPAGKALFFPVWNWEYDNALDPPTDYTVPELRVILEDVMDAVDSTDIYCRLDGVAQKVVRVKSPRFSYTMPAQDSLYDYFGLFGPQFEGKIDPVVADGFGVYVMPLPPGEYLLEFGYPDGGQDSTYHRAVLQVVRARLRPPRPVPRGPLRVGAQPCGAPSRWAPTATSCAGRGGVAGKRGAGCRPGVRPAEGGGGIGGPRAGPSPRPRPLP